MRRREDDLVAWGDDPVVRALLADPAADELAGEDDVMAAFRTTHTARRRRPGARHVGAGVTTIVVALGLSGGVAAAAYTHALPAPVQSAMHAVFGDVGVPPADTSSARHPAATHHRHSALNTGPTAALPSTHVVPSTTTHPRPAASGTSAPAPAAAASPSPTPTAAAAPVDSPAATPSSSPSATASASAAPAPAGLAVSAPRLRVPAGQRAALRGTLTTSDGAPVAGYRLYLLQRPAGESTWTRVAQGRTTADGTVTLRSPALTKNVALRMATGRGLHSRDVAIIELPRVSLSYAVTKDNKHYVVTVTVAGAQTSDTVGLARQDNGSWTGLRRKQLDDTMQLTFTLPAPTSGSVRYRIRVLRTDLHGQRDTFFTLPPPS